MNDFNIEFLYNLLSKNDFNKILELELENREYITKDVMLSNFFNTYFIPTVLDYINKNNNNLDSSIVLKNVFNRFIQHKDKTYSISKNDFENLVSKYILILVAVGKEKAAYSISKKWSHLKEADNFIKTYEEKTPKEILHSNSDNIKVSANNNIKKENLTIGLFKSIQEYEFFYSIIDQYPNHTIYPNVALSCLIDFDKIKDKLNKNESTYFFTAIIDCVVFKSDNNNFNPKYFFELDSIYHDTEKEIEKDRMKDKILSLAGQNLYRIRAKDNKSLKRDDFKTLINDILGN